MPKELNTPYVILCEGSADALFLEKMIDLHRLPRCTIFECQGITRVTERLRGIAGDAIGFNQLKGVLIVADSASDVGVTFKAIQKLVEAANVFPVPQEIGVSISNGGLLVAVTFLPDELSPGGLETLYAEERLQREPWLRPCLDQYLSCGQNDISNWLPEKVGKARFACIVAARNHEDPSKAASYILNNSPFIDITSSVFNPFLAKLQAFFAEASEAIS